MKVLNFIQGFFLTIVILMFAFLILVLIISETAKHDEIKIKTKCYDKLEHEIDNLTCNKEINCNYKWKFLDSIYCEEAVNAVNSEQEVENHGN